MDIDPTSLEAVPERDNIAMPPENEPACRRRAPTIEIGLDPERGAATTLILMLPYSPHFEN
ncbi:MAG: hypothetical protein JWO51_2020 [Rhodospirillales bacterium]|nr:hypothetical protein [Rhodospirillales bacterium]